MCVAGGIQAQPGDLPELRRGSWESGEAAVQRAGH